MQLFFDGSDLQHAGHSDVDPFARKDRRVPGSTCLIVDHKPVAWSFHYLHVVPTPAGFPPSSADLSHFADMASRIGAAFHSRLIATDSIRDRRGRWYFLEAGPGAACGTGHEAVFKFVASRLRGDACDLTGDSVGGPIDYF